MATWTVKGPDGTPIATVTAEQATGTIHVNCREATMTTREAEQFRLALGTAIGLAGSAR